MIVVDDNELLLIKRTESPAAGAWSLPAGYLEADEPPHQAAVRELREETDVKIHVDALELVDTVFVDHPDGTHVLVIVYAAPREATSGTLSAGSDAAAVRFWSVDALENHETERLEPGYEETLQCAQDSFVER